MDYVMDNYRAERAGRAEIGIGFVSYTALSHLLSVHFLDIIEPLADMWSHGSVLQVIKDHLVIFKPRVRISLVYGVQVSHILNINLDFATDCVEWTTCGICSLLKMIWDHFKTHVTRKEPVPHYWIKFTTALE